VAGGTIGASASRIPCVQTSPAGVVGALTVGNGESVLKLRHASVDLSIGTGGQPQAAAEAGSVTIRLTASCAQPTGNGQVIAPGVRRFPTQGPAGTPQVVDVFPGGCLIYQPDAGIGPSDPLLDQTQDAVSFRTREELRHALQRRSAGRLHLDAKGDS
jgi:hypothetical protein